MVRMIILVWLALLLSAAALGLAVYTNNTMRDAARVVAEQKRELTLQAGQIAQLKKTESK